MGWRTVADVRDHSAATGTTYTVLLMLAERAPDETRVARPGRAQLAQDSRCSVDTVTRALRWAEDAGEIEAVAYRKGGHGMATEWHLLVGQESHHATDEESQQRVSRVASGPKKSRTGATPTEENRNEPNTYGAEWQEWLEHYRETTGNTLVRGSAAARSSFGARRREGHTLAALKLATVGCHADDYNRTHGHNVPETILRASKVDRYVTLGRQHRARKQPRDGLAERARRDIAA